MVRSYIELGHRHTSQTACLWSIGINRCAGPDSFFANARPSKNKKIFFVTKSFFMSSPSSPLDNLLYRNQNGTDQKRKDT